MQGALSLQKLKYIVSCSIAAATGDRLLKLLEGLSTELRELKRYKLGEEPIA
jgi:hypothetical protein